MRHIILETFCSEGLGLKALFDYSELMDLSESALEKYDVLRKCDKVGGLCTCSWDKRDTLLLYSFKCFLNSS